MLKTSFPRLHRFAAARLSPQGEFGLHLTIGVALMVLAVWLFGSVAGEVMEGETATIDLAVAHWLHAHAQASAGFTRFMLAITHLHSVPGIIAMVLLLGAWLYRRGAYYWLLALAVTVPCGMMLNVLLKYTFQRARPSFDQPLLTLSTYSFPSGHTTAATVLYGFLATYLVAHARSWHERAVVTLLACLMVALVGLSRMYLGVHYPTDVLAAVAVGCAWLVVCITAVSTLRRRRAARGKPFWSRT
jgi:membrane-associated phospholipid phosphatase